jgi:hypothetical protein
MARAIASWTNGATDRTNIAPASQRSSVRQAGVPFAGENALRRAANIISQDPSFSAGAQAAPQNILRESEEGNARSVPQVAYSDAGSFTGQWTVYSGLGSDLEDESATPKDNLPVSENAQTWRSASTPPTDRSRALEGRCRHEDLVRRLGLSPSSERGTTEGASSFPTEAVRGGPLCSARSERCATEGASSYITEEFEGGLTLSKGAEQSEAEAASYERIRTHGRSGRGIRNFGRIRNFVNSHS